MPTRSVPTRSLPPLILSADPDGTSGEADRSGGCCRFTADVRPLQMERRECGTAGRGDSSLPQHIKQLHQHIHLLCVCLSDLLSVCACLPLRPSLIICLSLAACVSRLVFICCSDAAHHQPEQTSSLQAQHAGENPTSQKDPLQNSSVFFYSHIDKPEHITCTVELVLSSTYTSAETPPRLGVFTGAARLTVRWIHHR